MPRRRFRSLRRRMRPATGSPTMGANETGRLAGEREDAVPSARDRNYAMALLFAAMVLDYADRQVVSVLLPAFKQSLQLSLVQASIVSGLAFSLFCKSSIWSSLFTVMTTLMLGGGHWIVTSCRR